MRFYIYIIKYSGFVYNALVSVYSVCYLFLSMYQRTPLHIVAAEGYGHTVEHLFRRGADINIKDNDGVSV